MGMNIKIKVFIGGLIGVAVISALTFSSMGYGEEPVREYYASGKLKREVALKNGKPDGQVKGYYESGKLSFVSTYKDGKSDGPVKEYYESGQLRREGVYEKGELVKGTLKEYYKNGKVRAVRGQ